MDNFLWRSRARIVAYIDMVFSIFGLIATISAIFFSAWATVAVKKDGNDNPYLTLTVFIVWVIVAVMSIFVCFDMWAAVMLLKATKIGANPVGALRRACIWRNIVIVFLVFSVVAGVYQFAWISLAVSIMFRGTLLYIVCKFIEELQQASPRTRQANYVC